MEQHILLFETPGPENTGATLKIAKERAAALGIRQVVVASSHGETALKARDVFAPLDVKIIAVSICHGYESAGWTMKPEERDSLVRSGVIVHTGVQALDGGISSAFAEKRGGFTPEEIVRETLYRFSQGMKVAVECLLTAADAGLLDINQEVIAIAGTGSGADTAIVCKPAYPRTFNELEIREILAKPRIP